jgi:hypothetical protein
MSAYLTLYYMYRVSNNVLNLVVQYKEARAYIYIDGGANILAMTIFATSMLVILGLAACAAEWQPSVPSKDAASL